MSPRCAPFQAIVVEGDEEAMALWRASGWDEQVARRRFV